MQIESNYSAEATRAEYTMDPVEDRRVLHALGCSSERRWFSRMRGLAVAVQRGRIMGSLEGGRICNAALAHAAAYCIERAQVACLEPALKPAKQGFNVRDPVPEQRRGGHDDVRARKQVLQDLFRTIDARACGQ